MEYKRLTKKKITDGDIRVVLDENRNVVVDRRLFERFIKQHNRLAELEDKIEQGKLIELPCKVGDTIYIPWDWDGCSGVSFHEIVKIAIYPENILIVFEVDTDIAALKYGYYSDGVINISSLGRRFFLTREEAEKRLKELQG